MSSGKRRKVSRLNMDLDVVHWQWEAHGSVWTDFSQEQSEEIADAFNQGSQEVTVER